MKKIDLFIAMFAVWAGISSFDTPIKIINKNLDIIINGQMQMKITNVSAGSRTLMTGFTNSEYLVTDIFEAKSFSLDSEAKVTVHNQSGTGTQWTIKGNFNQYPLEKTVQITVYDNFPNTAYFKVSYQNKGDKTLTIKKWANNHYQIIPSENKEANFWSFQGSTHSDRRDWLQKVNRGLHHDNFMGMNQTDYGGGIPVLDLWRKDAGIAIGMADNIFRLVSLPLNFGLYDEHADIEVNYEPANNTTLEPGGTTETFETFVSVHNGDCFWTLENYSKYMQTKGIEAANSEPQAYESMWCAWGYERDFTVDEVIKTLPKVKELGIKWVGLDDGFFPALGDWTAWKKKFPRGNADMKAFVDSIHSYGLKAMLWWNPMAVSTESRFYKENPNILLRHKDESPEYVTWWNAFYPSPTDKTVVEDTRKTVDRFINQWGFDGLKLDGQNQNLCAPDYASGHDISYPDQSFELLPELFKEIIDSARAYKPDAVVQICPCGTVMNYFLMPYTNQFVSSDPESAWQVRLRALVYRALWPQTAFYGDHVELIGDDFASQFGVGSVLGTKFVWPEVGSASDSKLLLTPEKEQNFKKWFDLYHQLKLSEGKYLGEVYDVGYDFPEAHLIQKDNKFYYAFYNPNFSGKITLKGLDKSKSYQVRDYFNNKSLGKVSGKTLEIQASFKQFLLLEVSPL